MLIALFGAVAGQAVVWYTGQFYALFFLEKIAEGRRRDRQHPDRHRAGDRHAVLRRSSAGCRDRIGRKPIILAGCALAALTLFPAVRRADRGRQSRRFTRPQRHAPVTVVADPANCSFQFDPVGKNKFDSDRLRHRQVVPRQGRRLLCQRRRAGGQRRARSRIGDDR